MVQAVTVFVERASSGQDAGIARDGGDERQGRRDHQQK